MSGVATYGPIFVVFGAIIGAIAVYKVAILNSNASIRNADLQAHLSRQIKLAEFRQEWIHRLRDQMAEFQSYGVTPELQHFQERKFFEAGSKIELFLNKSDPDYDKISKLMYDFLQAETVEDKFECNSEFIDVCQAILKR